MVCLASLPLVGDFTEPKKFILHTRRGRKAQLRTEFPFPLGEKKEATEQLFLEEL
jgi:hypothetical protein